MKLKDNIAIVTGAGKGIGQFFCAALSEKQRSDCTPGGGGNLSDQGQCYPGGRLSGNFKKYSVSSFAYDQAEKLRIK